MRASLCRTTVGLFVVLFALHLAAALLAKRRPPDGEQHVTMLSFLLLVPAVLTQHLPPSILPLLSLFFAAYLHKARWGRDEAMHAKSEIW